MFVCFPLFLFKREQDTWTHQWCRNVHLYCLIAGSMISLKTWRRSICNGEERKGTIQKERKYQQRVKLHLIWWVCPQVLWWVLVTFYILFYSFTFILFLNSDICISPAKLIKIQVPCLFVCSNLSKTDSKFWSRVCSVCLAESCH